MKRIVIIVVLVSVSIFFSTSVHAGGSIQLSWVSDDPSVSNINIYRTTSSCLSSPNESFLQGVVRVPNSRFVDSNVVAGTFYSYTVFAVDSSGAYSDPVCISYTAPTVAEIQEPRVTPTVPTPTTVADAITMLVLQNKDLFLRAEAAGIALPQNILNIVHGTSSYVNSPVSSGTYTPAGSGTYYRDLTLGMSGSDVYALQRFLITQNKGPEARLLAQNGATGYFGNLTKYALAEYQYAIGIVPSTGYFGPMTRAKVVR